MKKTLILYFFTFIALRTYGQVNPHTGIEDEPHGTYLLTHAVLHIDPNTTIEDGSLWIADGKIIAAGKNITPKKEIKTIDCSGLHIYPSFIELSSGYGMPEIKRENHRKPQYKTAKEGAYYWNQAVKPETNAGKLFSLHKKSAEKLRSFGFGVVLTHVKDGIIRGTGSLVSLADEEDTKVVIRPDASQHFSFSKGVSGQEYPNSLTGTIALIRQFLYDARWYEKMKGKAEVDLSLEAFLNHKSLPYFFEIRDKLELFRAEKIAEEFGISFIYEGNGDEYQRSEALKNKNVKLVIPVDFPAAYDISDVYDADMLDLKAMKHWETAPANPMLLDEKDIRFAITSKGHRSSKGFFRNLRKACLYGLPEDKLLAALTTIPAKFSGIEKEAGTLEKGKLANFLITDGEINEKEFILLENWVQGQRHIVSQRHQYPDIRGTYTIATPGFEFMNGRKINIEGKRHAPSGTFLFDDTTRMNLNLGMENGFLTMSIYSKSLDGFIRITAEVSPDSSWNGNVETTHGKTFPFNALLSESYVEKEKKEKKEKEYSIGEIWYPNMAYGWKKDEQGNASSKYIIQNATIWTNEEEGILKGYDVAIANGKIQKIGQGLNTNGYTIIDGTGKHLTCGIIDEHSHIALKRGVNEGTQSSSAEVRMGDVVNSDDINIYRQLAGGVTTAQLLHGSANPIGGQSGLIKLRWGKLPDEMLFEDAPGFIKFALGENVKQSNWGSNYSIRYPQTRMGVEQFFFEKFYRARQYAQNKKKGKEPVRKDLEMETLWEIMEGKRFITCHSYRQSEINMLMKLGDSLGFRVNTFTHILEGYKIADKMKKHGANASTFSDWWAYKMEVMDAIPYNGAILSKVGVNTAINSDDAEMARRLNQEAAKLVKYGGLTQEEAWKTVTLNPAKMLHIDGRVGSIKTGKDADLVLWTDNPLSIYARVLTTWVDGTIYYDEARDKKLQRLIKSERNRLVQKMMQAKKDGEKTVPVNKKQQILYHCDDMGEGIYQIIQIGQ